MGLKDHREDGTGHILRLELDLDYLHVDGAERGKGGLRAGAGDRVRGGASSGSGTDSRGTSFSANSSCSSCSIFSDGSAVSDSEDGSEPANPPHDHLQESTSTHEPIGLDLTFSRLPGSPTRPETPASADCRTKVDFALKLGYSEDLVLLVLRKLGPHALINDILGELVKLGTKTTEMEQHGCPSVSQFPLATLSPPLSTLNPPFPSSLDSCRLLCPSPLLDKENLRPVVVDGSNVAMSHGNKEVFSCQGIQLAVDWFLERGHRDITVFVPAWRKEQSRPDALITDQEILRRLEKEKILVFTPSRRVQGRRVVCYDDRFIVKLAYESDGIIVSNDNYRDLSNEKPEWKKFVDERLLMYSFVNDKFMPPDDPLGRHGPSLDNFLRKKPVVLRKQPCPYGKKCTYGHKCKFYHPERGSQPQRAVADELRASAKMSSAASKGLLDDVLTTKCQSPGQSHGVAELEPSQGTPKKQPNLSPRSAVSDLMEDRLQDRSKVEGRRGSSSSSSSTSSSSCGSNHQGHYAPSSGNLDRWEHPGNSGGGSARNPGASGPTRPDPYHRCKSPELGYSALLKTFSNLSLEVPQSPERFFPADLRVASLSSDCSSEGSVSSDSFSPDLLLDDGPRCHHHHHHQHHHPPHLHHYTYPASRVPPGLGQHALHSYPITQVLQRQFGFGSEEPSSSPLPQVTPHPFRTPSGYVPQHLQHPPMSGISGEFPNLPQRSPQTPISYSQSRNSTSSLWQEGGLPDSRLYEGSPLLSRRNYSEMNHQPLPQINWEPLYQRSPKPYHDAFTFQGRSRQVHSTPCGLAASSPPPPPPPSSLPPLSFTPISPHKTHHLPLEPQQRHNQEPLASPRYQDLRDRMFVNLCCIFPPDLVRVVMARKPHVMDAQELAAAILLEKTQLSS